MSLRDALEEIAAGLPYKEGASVMRVAQVLGSRADPADYWRSRGRARFERELLADGIDAALVADVLTTVELALAPDDDVNLDDILDDLRRRTS